MASCVVERMGGQWCKSDPKRKPRGPLGAEPRGLVTKCRRCRTFDTPGSAAVAAVPAGGRGGEAAVGDGEGVGGLAQLEVVVAAPAVGAASVRVAVHVDAQ